MEHAMKVLERIVDRMRREILELRLNQLYSASIDREKAYDRIAREVVYWYLRKWAVSEKFVRLLMEMYVGCQH